MRTEPSLAEVNIHLRARAEDKNIIDQAANLIGANRSQFMLASALKEAKNILLDQTTFHVSTKQFNAILDWIDSEPSAEASAGMKRLARTKLPW